MAIAICVISCKETTPPPVPTNDAENITTVKIELTDTLTGQKLNFYFRDLDGEGGKTPSQWDTIKLSDSSYYKVSLKFMNESNPNAVQNITAVIEQKKTDHIICLIPVGIITTITRTDTDGTYPLGVTSTWKTGAASSGDITITLKHQPGLKNGGCSPGETDAEVKFQAMIR